MRRVLMLACVAVLAMLLDMPAVRAQTSASPSNWLYLQGNSQGTRYQPWPYDVDPGQRVLRPQVISADSFSVKWVAREIRGDVQPLVGNIVQNGPLAPSNPWAPNEMAAVVDNAVVILGADGRVVSSTPLRFPFTPSLGVSRISVLFDSLALAPSALTNFPMIMGLETIENPFSASDTVAYGYIAAYDQPADTVRVLKRLSIDLRPYGRNITASVSPIFGRLSNAGDQTVFYAGVNMIDPRAEFNVNFDPPFFRGLAQFLDSSFAFPFPKPDLVDDFASRMTVGPPVTLTPPSIALIGSEVRALMPCFPTPVNGLTEPIPNTRTFPTSSDGAYLFDFRLDGNQPDVGAAFTELFDIPASQRPYIQPMFVDLVDAFTGNEDSYIAVLEQYGGRVSSRGRARIHLFRSNGEQLTIPDASDEILSFNGELDHGWSLGTGDIDGWSVNESLPYFPNNIGKEIVVTQSTREFAFPQSKLMVLRWNSSEPRVPKPTVSAQELRYLDTLATMRINGWLAAVSDLDGAQDSKAEMVLVDNETVRIVRMRDYSDPLFRLGQPFEEIFQRRFAGEEIHSVVVADLEGDGYNDLVVTTAQRTWVLGRREAGSLQVRQPLRPTPVQKCDGDTVLLEWVIRVGGIPTVSLYWQPYAGNNPSGQRRTLASLVPNTADTMRRVITLNRAQMGGSGRLVVVNDDNTAISDSSAIITIDIASIALTQPPATSQAAVGDIVPISGQSSCVSRVEIELFIDSAWQVIDTPVLAPDGSFSSSWTVACNSGLNCFVPDDDSIAIIRAVGYTASDTLLSTQRRIRIVPAALPVSVDPVPPGPCPVRILRWQPPTPPEALCDSVAIAFSADSGATFSILAIVPVTDLSWEWKLPLGLPDTVLVRFCCLGACAKGELLIGGTEVKYVQIVAPNPFNPTSPTGSGTEAVSVLYTVPAPARVTIRIFDQSDRLVATPIRDEFRSVGVTHCDRWDGRLDLDDALAPNGMYYLLWETDSGLKEIWPIFVASGY